MNQIRPLLVLTFCLGLFYNISLAQYEIGKPYNDPVVIMEYCCLPCTPKSKLEHALNALPAVVIESLQTYWMMNFDSLFLQKLTFRHVQIIRCIWSGDSLSQKVRYEIGYRYSDSARGINSYSIRLVFDSAGHIHGLKRWNEANFPRNKNKVSKLFLLDKSIIDKIVERNSLSGGRLFYNDLYEHNLINLDTMLWVFIKRKRKKLYHVYVDAFTGEILLEHRFH